MFDDATVICSCAADSPLNAINRAISSDITVSYLTRCADPLSAGAVFSPPRLRGKVEGWGYREHRTWGATGLMVDISDRADPRQSVSLFGRRRSFLRPGHSSLGRR